MKLLIDTSTLNCRLTLINADGEQTDYSWRADRSLARDLLAFLRDKLADQRRTFADIEGLAIMKGPGSFTGLRIGVTVFNTLADSLAVPIVGEVGEDWRAKALSRLANGENDGIVMPDYGSEANITKPRK